MQVGSNPFKTEVIYICFQVWHQRLYTCLMSAYNPESPDIRLCTKLSSTPDCSESSTSIPEREQPPQSQGEHPVLSWFGTRLLWQDSLSEM